MEFTYPNGEDVMFIRFSLMTHSLEYFRSWAGQWLSSLGTLHLGQLLHRTVWCLIIEAKCWAQVGGTVGDGPGGWGEGCLWVKM